MSGKLESLRQSLARLQAQLTGAPPMDAQSRALLEQRLEMLAVEFEGKHPSVAAALREVMELLAQAGI